MATIGLKTEPSERRAVAWLKAPKIQPEIRTIQPAKRHAELRSEAQRSPEHVQRTLPWFNTAHGNVQWICSIFSDLLSCEGCHGTLDGGSI